MNKSKMICNDCGKEFLTNTSNKTKWKHRGVPPRCPECQEKKNNEIVTYICKKCGAEINIKRKVLAYKASWWGANPLCKKCMLKRRKNKEYGEYDLVDNPATCLHLYDPYPNLFVFNGMDEICNGLRVGMV